MSEASTADLRAKLDRVVNDCVMPFRYKGEEYALELVAALGAVLDVLDDVQIGIDLKRIPTQTVIDVIHARVAAALGVQRATPPAEPWHRFVPRNTVSGKCGALMDGGKLCGRGRHSLVHRRSPDPSAGCACGHGWEYHGPECPGCIECGCPMLSPGFHQQRGERADG